MLADVTSVQLPVIWFCLALTGECCGCLLYTRLPLSVQVESVANPKCSFWDTDRGYVSFC